MLTAFLKINQINWYCDLHNNWRWKVAERIENLKKSKRFVFISTFIEKKNQKYVKIRCKQLSLN